LEDEAFIHPEKKAPQGVLDPPTWYRPTQSIIHVPLQVNRFQKIILLIFQAIFFSIQARGHFFVNIQQSRAEQSRAEQSRAELSRAEQSRAEQSRAEQSRAEQSRAV